MKRIVIFLMSLVLFVSACDSPQLTAPEQEPPPEQQFPPVAKVRVETLEVEPGDTVKVRDNGSFARGSATLEEWRVTTPDGVAQSFSSNDFTVDGLIPSAGRFIYQLEVRDNNGLWSTPDKVEITAVLPPTEEDPEVSVVTRIKFAGVADTASSLVFRTLPFEACVEDGGSTASDNGGISTIHWQMSDGQNAEGMQACFPITRQGIYFVQGQAEAMRGAEQVLGNVVFLAFNVDTTSPPKPPKPDTVKLPGDTVVTPPDTVTFRPPVALGRILNEEVIYVGDVIKLADGVMLGDGSVRESFSPDGLRIVEWRWLVPGEDWLASGQRVDYTPTREGSHSFVLVVVDERGGISAPFVITIGVEKKDGPVDPPNCGPSATGGGCPTTSPPPS